MAVINGISGKDDLIGTSDDDVINGEFASDVIDLTVGAMNSAPTFDDTLGGVITYAVMGQPVILDGNVSIRDAELDALNNGAGDYAGASLLMVRHGGASSGDFFGFSTAGAAFTVSGNLLQSGGQTFATYSAVFGQLAITFTSTGTAATRALVENVLAHVTYTLTSSAPPATVQIDWRLNDGNTGAQGDGGAMLATASTTVALSDPLSSSISTTLPEPLQGLVLTGTGNINGTGNSLANTITGNSGNNVLDGLAGADTMTGGAGNDTYKVDNGGDLVVESANGGNDTLISSVTYALADNVENLTLTGASNLNATGNALDNVLTGNDAAFAGEGKNTLVGGAGNDLLDGRTGFDTLQGGPGDDTYIINDSMRGATSLALRGEPGNFIAGGVAHFFNTDTGLFTSQVLDGNGDGGAEFVGFIYEDLDPVWHRSTLSFSTSRLASNLAPGTYLNAERTPFASAGHPGLDVDFDGRGSNTLYGSFTVHAVNVDFSGPTPILLSFSASFEQHSDNPTAPALFGTINYNYQPAGPTFRDSVVENPGEGSDTVISSLATTLPDNIENLTLTGNENNAGNGNELDNIITGNSGDNLLTGGFGDDSISGGLGQDVLDGGAGSNTLSGGIGDDTYVIDHPTATSVVENLNEGGDTALSSVTYTLPTNVEILSLIGSVGLSGTGNAGANLLNGNSGNNVLAGDGGNDRLVGGAGNDVLNGGSDLDSLQGGLGDDIYIINDTKVLGGPNSLTLDFTRAGGQTHSFDTTVGTLFKTLFDLNGDGQIDFIRFFYQGPGHFSSLEFSTTSVGTNLTPGFYPDVKGSPGATPGHPGLYVAFDGGTLADASGNFTVHAADFDYSGPNAVLRSFSVSFEYNDTPSRPWALGTFDYNVAPVGSTVSDYVIDKPDEGTDTVQSSVSYTLPADVENLTLTGTAAIDGLGNALANVITGNAGNNTLIGGSGNDTYILNVGFGHDLIIDQDATSGNFDTIRFGSGMTSGAVIVEQVGSNDSDIRLSFIGSADAVIMQGWLTSDNSKVERLEFADDVVWGVQNILNRITFHTQNHAPTLDNSLADQVATEDTAFSFTVPVDAFSDVDVEDILTFTATRADGSTLPSWLTFNPANRAFSGTPVNGDVGTDSLKVTATDSGGLSAFDTFDVTVANTNDAPTLATALADQSATAGTTFGYTLPANSFTDVDAGYILSFTATRADGLALPGWLAFDAATRTFSGMPATADAGTLRVRVTATDTANASAADELQLTVTGNKDGEHNDRRKGNEGVGNGADPPPPGHDHNQNDGPGAGPGNPGSRQQTNDRDRGRVRTADRHSSGSNSDSAHRDESIGELVQAYLARKPDYGFEALAWEPQRSQRRDEVLNPLEIVRRWTRMHRYIDALGETDDEETRYGAVVARRGFFGQDAAGLGLGVFDHNGSKGSAHGAADLRVLQGLEEGFTRLRT